MWLKLLSQAVEALAKLLQATAKVLVCESRGSGWERQRLRAIRPVNGHQQLFFLFFWPQGSIDSTSIPTIDRAFRRQHRFGVLKLALVLSFSFRALRFGGSERRSQRSF